MNPECNYYLIYFVQRVKLATSCGKVVFWKHYFTHKIAWVFRCMCVCVFLDITNTILGVCPSKGSNLVDSFRRCILIEIVLLWDFKKKTCIQWHCKWSNISIMGYLIAPAYDNGLNYASANTCITNIPWQRVLLFIINNPIFWCLCDFIIIPKLQSFMVLLKQFSGCCINSIRWSFGLPWL